MAKFCIVCGIRPRELPDRNQIGRPIKRVCRQCHRQRLANDARVILRAALSQAKAGADD